jgi:thiol-disulfide isomerase/thioredoxin
MLFNAMFFPNMSCPKKKMDIRCGPCIQSAPVLSELAEKYPEVAILGINNQAIFSPKPYEPEVVSKFLEENKGNFRYSAYIDTAEGHARDSTFSSMSILTSDVLFYTPSKLTVNSRSCLLHLSLV